MHPAWMLDYFRNGMPEFEDWTRYAGDNADARAVASFLKTQGRRAQTWSDVDHFRRLWPGNFVLKGILHSDDALRPPMPASTGSSYRTTAAAGSIARQARSRSSRRSTPPSATG
jgi:hypothetical protein